MEHAAGIMLYPQGDAPAEKFELLSGSCLTTVTIRPIPRPVSRDRHPEFWPHRAPFGLQPETLRDYSWSDSALTEQSGRNGTPLVVFQYLIRGNPDRRVCHVGATFRFTGNALHRLWFKGRNAITRHHYGNAPQMIHTVLEGIQRQAAQNLVERFQQPGVEVLELMYEESGQPSATIHLEWVNRPAEDTPLEVLAGLEPEPEPITPIPDRRRKRGRYYDTSEPEKDEEEGNPQFY